MRELDLLDISVLMLFASRFASCLTVAEEKSLLCSLSPTYTLVRPTFLREGGLIYMEL